MHIYDFGFWGGNRYSPIEGAGKREPPFGSANIRFPLGSPFCAVRGINRRYTVLFCGKMQSANPLNPGFRVGQRWFVTALLQLWNDRRLFITIILFQVLS